LWSFVCLFTFIWGGALFGVITAGGHRQALFWQYILDISAIFIPVFYCHFVIVFTRNETKFCIIKKFIYAFAFLLVILSFTPLFKISVEPAFNFNYWINPGPWYFLFPLFYLFLIILIFYTLLKTYLDSSGVYKVQLLYVLLAGVIGFGGGITNFFPQLIDVYPIGNYFVILYVFLVAYAITRYRFLDIRVLIARSIIYIFLVAIIIIPLILIGIYYNKFFVEQWGVGQILASLALALIIVFGLEPLKRLISRATDKYLFKGKIDYRNVTRHLSKIINKEFRLDSLVSALSKDLKKALKLDKVAILLPKNGDYCFESEKKEEIKYDKGCDIVKLLKKDHELIIKEEVDRKITDASLDSERVKLEKVKNALDEYDYSLAAPVTTDNKLIAILLIGNKLSGEMYSHEDVRFFEIVAPQIATAISKAYLYQDLENRVDELIQLNELSRDLSKTLKIEKALDHVMESVIKLTGCDRGLLYLLDEKTKILTAVVGKGDKKEVYEGIKIKVGESILKRVIITKKPLTVEDVEKTPGVAKYAKDRLKTQAFIAVPMLTKDNVIGVIGVDNQKSGRPLSEINVSLLQTLASQAAISVENARLYDELNEFNITLQDKVDKATEEIKKLYVMKGEFLDIASHQLRTPVSVITGTLDMLREGSIQKLPKKQQERFIDNAFRKSRKLESIINDILNASEMDTGKFDVAGTTKPVQIEELVDKVMADFENEAYEKGLKFVFIKPAKALPEINASPRYLEQVISNLIDNAIKYTEKGSVKVQVAKKDKKVVVSVKDTGLGVPKDDMPKLFQKFVRAQNARNIYTDGSGLGLFIIKKIVEGHKDGKVWVESKEGRGSTFYFSLPL